MKALALSKCIRLLLLVMFGVAAVNCGVMAQEKLQRLIGAQIRSKLAGMELTDNIHWRDLYERSGKATSNSMGRKRIGQWRIEGDRFCIEYEKEPSAKCYEVWASGKNVELRSEGLLPLQGTLEKPTGRR